ncbi:membrane protein implicated in regulation of membrane protease activity [Kitasatospora sp. GP30]|uniref:hypothetical protein n=1 Tax=Kitasatospora sp. GP30 TaxID=3035084 RepID=UPI000C704791|nr:hypothetical protein [Kitasatospora sp. GP30]MDH6141168.1 membrane protein implicated in regulation of membrane protease activity [Kitasatospora sp. GP30]
MSRVSEFNERLAVRATRVFGSMPTTYLFFAYGFLPVLVPAWMATLLYWSNTVQLWSLPLLMVGQAVLGRAAERRSSETHDTVMEELGLIRELVNSQHANDPAPTLTKENT